MVDAAAVKKKRYSPVCLSLSSTDTEQEEESYRRKKKDKIGQLRRKLEAEITKRAERYSSTESSQRDDSTSSNNGKENQSKPSGSKAS